MQRRWDLKFICILGLTASPTLTPLVLADERPQPGLVYTTKVNASTIAEPSAAVQRPILADRRGFGETIHFTPGDPADSLFPPGWAKQRGAVTAPRN